MRIHRVDLTGFGPYRDTESVNFEEFADDGVFLITGRTGAGKSSLLDAITFALFGSIPRYDAQPGTKVRSDHLGPLDPCEVSVEFTVGHQRYRVRRTPEWQRPKQRGEGTTKQAATAELAELVGDQWQVTESQVRNVGLAISEILRLSGPQFLQVILLAQGQFQEFLVADSTTRRDLLRSLFRTQRFTDYSQALDDRARALGSALAGSAEATATHLGAIARTAQVDIPEEVDRARGTGAQAWVEAIIDDHAAIDTQARQRVAEAKSALDAAREELSRVTALADRQRRRAAAAELQHRLQERQEDVDALAARAAAASRAEIVAPVARAARAAEERLEAARAGRADAETAYRDALGPLPEPADGESVDAPLGALERIAALAEQRLGHLAELAATERRLPVLTQDLERATQELTAFDNQISHTTTRRTTARESLDALAAPLAEHQLRAEAHAEADTAVQEARRRLAAGQAAEATAAELDRAKHIQLEAGRTRTAATAEQDALRARQLAGYAATLAADLTDGVTCPVCGATDHPAPAAPAADHVTEADLRRADADVERADLASRAADAQVERLTTQLAGELQASGGTPVEELATAVTAAQEELAEVVAARTEVRRIRARQEELRMQIQELTERLDGAAAGREALVAARSAAQTALRSATEVVIEGRGDYPSIAAQVEAQQSERDLARDLCRNIEEAARAHTTAAESLRSLQVALAEQEFADLTVFQEACVPRADRAAWEQQVAAHTTAMATAAHTLAEPELQDLPAEPVDRSAATEAHRIAEAAHTDAVATASGLAEVLKSIRSTFAELQRVLTAAAVARADFETVDALAQAVRGVGPNELRMPLETFVLAAELEEIVDAANQRLGTMTGQRYRFAHSDALAARNKQSGLDLTVLDAHTGQSRSPQSLSGGEKFQASLALALGLAEVVTQRAGGIRLDTLFIDEGFGSLDSETLETTMATLDSLREGGRTIGLISHVEAMKESIPAKVYVDIAPGGWSTIR